MSALDPVEQEPRAQAVAALLMELAPLIMRVMRQEMATHSATELSVPQFRALRFVGRQPGGSLSALAERLGASLPAASKLVDRLVDIDLLARATDPRDRRQVTLELTDRGRVALHAAHSAAQQRLAEQLAALPADALDQCSTALGNIRAAVALSERRE